MRKVTIYAAMVTLAGVLAEIILRDTLVKTTLGIILCIVLAVITLIAGYLAIDTAFEWILQNKKRELEQKKESEKKLCSVPARPEAGSARSLQGKVRGARNDSHHRDQEVYQ